jgi:hypothetical protein
MMAATAQESMYLDFMDCPPTNDLAAGISRKPAEESQREGR